MPHSSQGAAMGPSGAEGMASLKGWRWIDLFMCMFAHLDKCICVCEHIFEHTCVQTCGNVCTCVRAASVVGA